MSSNDNDFRCISRENNQVPECGILDLQVYEESLFIP